MIADVSGWTVWHRRQWRRLFFRNAREGYGIEPAFGDIERAEALREMGWSPHRAAAEIYERREA